MGKVTASATIEAHLKRHAADLKARESKRRREDEESARKLAQLQAQLRGEKGRADSLAESLDETKGNLRRNGAALRRAISRGEERHRDIQTKATSSGASSSGTTYTDDEVEEMEGVMGDLTAQLTELRKTRKDDEAEYDRNRQAVASFRSKYSELADLKRANLALQAEVERVTAERDAREPQSPRAPEATHVVPIFDIRRDSSKRGAP